MTRGSGKKVSRGGLIPTTYPPEILEMAYLCGRHPCIRPVRIRPSRLGAVMGSSLLLKVCSSLWATCLGAQGLSESHTGRGKKGGRIPETAPRVDFHDLGRHIPTNMPTVFNTRSWDHPGFVRKCRGCPSTRTSRQVRFSGFPIRTR